MTAGDQARAMVSVPVPPEAAFRIFTEEIDRWWRRGLKYRVAGKRRGILHLEPYVGGRLFESFELGPSPTGTAEASETRGRPVKVVETGRVLVWEPPSRLVFEWRAVNFKKDEATEVEVCFEPSQTGTRVTVTHRGWTRIRADHPARHGLEVAAFLQMMGLWWGELLTSLRMHAIGEEP
jgi:uncharacterized protein YndB with AHSA1/START domain